MEMRCVDGGGGGLTVGIRDYDFWFVNPFYSRKPIPFWEFVWELLPDRCEADLKLVGPTVEFYLGFYL